MSKARATKRELGARKVLFRLRLVESRLLDTVAFETLGEGLVQGTDIDALVLVAVERNVNLANVLAGGEFRVRDRLAGCITRSTLIVTERDAHANGLVVLALRVDSLAEDEGVAIEHLNWRAGLEFDRGAVGGLDVRAVHASEIDEENMALGVHHELSMGAGENARVERLMRIR